MPSGPILIGYDGSPAADNAIREAGELLAGRPALVLSVWKEGVGFELLELPTATIGLPPAQIDIATALDIERSLAEGAERAAQHGAELARQAGFAESQALVVADEIHVPVAETIVRVASDHDAQAIVVGAHGHGRVPILGSTSRDVIRSAPCPVVVVRHEETERREGDS
jgi:nucleotide-binding universal stress UspA family protein